MIAFIALFIPAVFLVWMREKLRGGVRSKEPCSVIAEYAFAVLLINTAMLLVLVCLFHNTGNVFYNLNAYSDFACKYILLAMVFAAAGPAAEHFMKNRLVFRCIGTKKRVKDSFWRWAAWIYSAVLFGMNFIRILDNNFWNDEIGSISAARSGFSEIVEWTAGDYSPPLYYFWLKVLSGILGDHGWVYHLGSIIPYAAVVIFALTAVWKRFGKVTAIILVTLASLTENAVYYNVEVRMYGLGALFVLLSFFELYEVLETGKRKNYLLFIAFSLLAAYTHYFCLVSVAFFYAALLLAAVFGKADRKKTAASCIITVAGYLPWFLILLKALGKASSSGFWITNTFGFKKCFEYLFSEQFPPVVYGLIIIGIVVVVLYELNILRVDIKPERSAEVTVDLENVGISQTLIWILAGILSIVGTITVGVVVSAIVRPMFVLRYMYPVSIVAWLLLGVVVSRLKGKRLYAILLLLFMIFTFVPDYVSMYTEEKQANDTLKTTLAATVDEIDAGDVILTNHRHISRRIAGYYYPEAESRLITLGKVPKLDDSVCYWLVVSGKQDMEKTFEEIEKQGFSHKSVVSEGNLGTHTVYIYKIEVND